MQWWRRVASRVRARELQLKAWRHLLPAGAAQQAEAQLALLEIARILTLCLAFVAGVVLGEDNRAIGFVAVAVAWPIVAIARLLLRDLVLGHAFAKMRRVPDASANVIGAAPFVASVAHKAKPEKAESIAKPKLSDSDRDAVDFDDAA